MGITDRFEELIEISGISQREISRRAGQRSTWLSDLLRAWRGHGRQGREPTIGTLRALARGLGIPLRELLGSEILDAVSRSASHD